MTGNLQDLGSILETYRGVEDTDVNPMDIFHQSNVTIMTYFYSKCQILKDYKLKVLHLNLQGLWSKLDDFREYIAKLHDADIAIDVILLCEAFLNN